MHNRIEESAALGAETLDIRGLAWRFGIDRICSTVVSRVELEARAHRILPSLEAELMQSRWFIGFLFPWSCGNDYLGSTSFSS